jgi:hypothetical protein
MSNSAKARVNDLWATDSHQLREQKINMILAGMEAIVNQPKMISITECRQHLVCLNTA